MVSHNKQSLTWVNCENGCDVTFEVKYGNTVDRKQAINWMSHRFVLIHLIILAPISNKFITFLFSNRTCIQFIMKNILLSTSNIAIYFENTQSIIFKQQCTNYFSILFITCKLLLCCIHVIHGYTYMAQNLFKS